MLTEEREYVKWDAEWTKADCTTKIGLNIELQNGSVGYKRFFLISLSNYVVTRLPVGHLLLFDEPFY